MEGYDKRTPHQQLITQAEGNVVTDQQKHPAARFRSAFLGLGVVQLILGPVSIILGALAVSQSVVGDMWLYGMLVPGISGGCWYIAAGGLALATGLKPNKCTVIGGMVVSILTCLAAFGAGAYEATIAGVFTVSCESAQLVYSAYHTDYDCSQKFEQVAQGIHAALAGIGFLQFVIAIVHSSYCCAGCNGCCGNTNEGHVVSTTVLTVPATHIQLPMQQGYGQSQFQYVAQQPPSIQGHANPAFGHSQQKIDAQPPTYAQ